MDNTTSAVLVAIGSVIALMIREGIAAIITWRGTRHTQSQSIRQDTLNEYKDLLDRHTKRIAELEIREIAIQKRCVEYERNYERATARIEHLEEVLRKEGIEFKPWVDRISDSGPHTPLPEGKKSV